MKKFLLLVAWIAMVFYIPVNAQNQLVNGIVYNSENQTPMAGVSVIVKGTAAGTITNNDGKFSINVPEPAQSLQFSFIGMKTVEVRADNFIEVYLEPDMAGIDEVVVVAYGTMQRKHVSGSVSVIRSSQLERFPEADISKSLQGLASGILTSAGSGQPGEGAQIRVRGVNTFGDASPLIVLDGFVYEGKLSAIPLSEIQSVSVLKDAAATALYGSRASGGVIIITTKTGWHGEADILLKVRYGISGRAVPFYETVSAGEYYELQWEGIRNSLITGGTSAEEAGNMARNQLVTVMGGYNAYNVPDAALIGNDGKINPDARLLWTDSWEDELFVRGQRREVALSARGGTEKSVYFLSGSFLDDNGIIKASNLKRYAVRANLKSQLNRRMSAGVLLSGSLSEQNYPVSSGTGLSNAFNLASRIAPIYPVYLYNREGELQTDDLGNKMYDFGTGFGRARPYASNINPLATIELDERLYKNDVFTLRTYIDLILFNGLTFKASLGGNHYTFTGLTHINQQYGEGTAFKGRTSRESSRTFSYSSNQMLVYEKNNDIHSIHVLAGHENYDFKFNTLSATRSGFPFPGLTELDAAATGEGSGSYEDNYRLESYLAKVDYGFHDRYFLNLNFRTDGNSRFARNVRWGDYWGAGLSWMVSSESFLRENAWLNVLRVKTSYGQQGNDKIGSFYGYQGLYQTGINNINYPGLLANRLATPELTWETLNSFNIGADVELFHRIALSFEYYIRHNNDLLFEQPLPPSTGFTSVDANIARLSNRGADLELGVLIVNSRMFTWRTDINLGHFQNKILELPQEYIISGNKRWERGRSVYDFWIEDFAGVEKETGLSQWYYNIVQTDAGGNPVTENGRPVLTGERGVTTNYSKADRYYFGSSLPKIFGGVNNTFTAGGFSLSALLTFASGGKVLDQPYQWLMHSGMYGYNLHKDMLNRWATDNTETKVPVINGDQLAGSRSTRFIANGSYLNIRNVSVGYQLPAGMLRHVELKDARITLSADNVALLTARQGLDPRQSLDGTMGMSYSPVRTVSVGFDIHF